jgi:hypothetical protein
MVLVAMLVTGGLMVQPTPAQKRRALAGPDMAIAMIISWSPPAAGQDGSLSLSDGSRWRLSRSHAAVKPTAGLIDMAAQQRRLLFVSGSRASGEIEAVALPRRLSAVSVGQEVVDGRIAVSFAGPPSVYYLHTRRTWFNNALALLQNSAGSQHPLDRPDLLVTIDMPSNEIVDVRPSAWADGVENQHRKP